MVDYLDGRDLIRWCGTREIGVQCYEPLGSSVLTGAIRRDSDVDALWGGHLKEWAMFDRLLQGERFDRSMDVVEGLRELGEDWGATIAQLAVAWVVHQPGVSVAIAGSTNPEHIRSNGEAGDLDLSAEQLDELDSIVLLGPAFA